jgi:hypothetical protein
MPSEYLLQTSSRYRGLLHATLAQPQFENPVSGIEIVFRARVQGLSEDAEAGQNV